MVISKCWIWSLQKHFIIFSQQFKIEHPWFSWTKSRKKNTIGTYITQKILKKKKKCSAKFRSWMELAHVKEIYAKKHFQHGNLSQIYSVSSDILSYSCTQYVRNYLLLLQVSKRSTELTSPSGVFSIHKLLICIEIKRHLQLFFIRRKNDLEWPIRLIKEKFFP